MSNDRQEDLWTDIHALVSQGTSNLEWEIHAYTQFLGDFIDLMTDEQLSAAFQKVKQRLEETESEENIVLDDMNSEDFEEAKEVFLKHCQSCA